MIVLDRYTLPPHVCYHCRTDRTPCVYTQREDEDARGPNSEHIFFCYECLLHAAREVAPLVGYLVMKESTAVERDRQLRELGLQLEEAYAQRDLAVAARDAVVASLAANPLPLATAITEGGPQWDVTIDGEPQIMTTDNRPRNARWRDKR